MKPTYGQIMEWVREAEIELTYGIFPQHYNELAAIVFEAGYKAGRKDENEACSKVCEELGMTTNGIYERNQECAAAIRARREQ